MQAIINAKILTMAEKEFENGFIIWDDGKIIEVGEGAPTFKVDDVIDAKGNYLLPGFVDPHCHIGMWGDGVGFEGEDGNESVDPVTPHLRAIDSIYSDDRCFTEAREAGVTTVVTGPGSANIFGGQFAALKTFGRCVDEMILLAPSALKIALGENPKNIYNEKKQSPITRMASASIFREMLFKAQEYDNEIMLHETNPEDNSSPDFDIKLDVLRKALSGELLVKIHAHRTDDIATAIRISEEFALNYTIEHCTEGYLMVDYLVEKEVKAIVGPILCDRSKIELKNLNIKGPGILFEKGVKIALMTDHPVTPIQYLPICAAVAAREGLGEKEALKAITINAAELNKIDSRVGSLESGKDADFVIFDGFPLDIKTKVLNTFINGEMVYAR